MIYSIPCHTELYPKLMTTPTQSPGLLSYYQIPETFDFVSLHSADGWIELLLFIHNDLVTIPNNQTEVDDYIPTLVQEIQQGT